MITNNDSNTIQSSTSTSNYPSYQQQQTGEYARALHSFQPNPTSNTCLTFSAGEIIKTLNKDNSGWWDGELNGLRGWFPSNYVEVLVPSSSPGDRIGGGGREWEGNRQQHQEEYNSNHYRHDNHIGIEENKRRESETSSILSNSTRSLSISSSNQSHSNSQSRSNSISSTSNGNNNNNNSNEGGVLESIQQAITLLQNAVLSNRINHFQPSTACVISSVRTVLSSTDCLTRESKVLRRHPPLALERKKILASLASLVNQARRASTPSNSSSINNHEVEGNNNYNNDKREEDTELMLSMAEEVSENVNNFLFIAAKLGVRLAEKDRPSTLPYTDDGSYDGRDRDRSGSLPFGPVSRRIVPDLRPARSLSDLRGKRPDLRVIAGNSNTGSSISYQGNSNAITSPRDGGHGFTSYKSNNNNNHHHNNVSSPPLPQQSQFHNPTSPTLSTTSSSISSPNACPPSPTTLVRSTLELNDILSSIHDQLLSTIAAFIGHVHAHTRSSHSSSYAYLIDMTRETIEKVREILIIVESVSIHPLLPSTKSLELIILSNCRETLYVATTTLVTAARIATSAPVEGDSQLIEEEEKRSLLHSATAVLRSGGDCVGAVKNCISKREAYNDLFELVLPDLDAPVSTTNSQSSSSNRRSTNFDRVDEDGNVIERRGSNSSRSGNKSPHTLSMLGRKATSLSCLRDMYEAGTPNGFAAVVEEGEEEAFAEQQAEEERRIRSQSGNVDQLSTSSNSNRNRAYSDAIRQSGRYSPENYNDDNRRGKNGTPLPPMSNSTNSGIRSRAMSASSSSETTNETVSLSSRNSPTNSISGRSSFNRSTNATPSISPIDSSRSVSSVPMSRGESSMTSESATSSGRSQMSRTSTNETSPRSSGTSAHTDMNLISKLHGPQSSSPNLSSRNSIIPPLPSPVSPMYPPTLPLNTSSFKDGNAWFLERDYEAREISFNGDGHVTGGTLKCLIERMTLHDTTIDLTFSKTFFLTFRMFTTPTELSEALFTRFDISPPTSSNHSPMTAEEIKLWNDSKATPVRLRIYNLFKTWVESYWNHETDSIIVESLITFCRGTLAQSMTSASIRLIDLLQKRSVPLPVESNLSSSSPTSAVVGAPLRPVRPLLRTKSSDRLGRIISPTGEPYPLTSNSIFGSIPPPPSILAKNLLASLRTSSNISITEIDPLELARQLTIMESRLYCRVKAGELLGMDISKKLSIAVNVRAMSTLSTRLTGWCAETILNEGDAKKRTGLIKYFIKLCDRCLSLNNYNTLMAVLCALNSSTISRLKKTWEGLSSKYKVLLDVLRKATEHSRNYAEYRAKIRNAVPPCLPFLGLFLTDITFCYEGNPAERPSPVDSSLRLINFDRYQKMSKIVTDLQRFQQPYNLIEVPEIQNYLSQALDGLQHGGDVTSLYRQSLMLEPRAPNDAANSYNPSSMGRSGELFNWKS